MDNDEKIWQKKFNGIDLYSKNMTEQEKRSKMVEWSQLK